MTSRGRYNQSRPNSPNRLRLPLILRKAVAIAMSPTTSARMNSRLPESRVALGFLLLRKSAWEETFPVDDVVGIAAKIFGLVEGAVGLLEQKCLIEWEAGRPAGYSDADGDDTVRPPACGMSRSAMACRMWRAHRPVRALDPIELKRTGPLRLLIQAYCLFSSGGAACEAAAAPAGAFVSGSARNLPIICGTSAEVMKL
jgi:hypothetical protein